jgi:hypothetical protein
MDEELQPCPFCGSPARVIPYLDKSCVIECSFSGCGVRIDTLRLNKQQKEVWNRRTNAQEETS